MIQAFHSSCVLPQPTPPPRTPQQQPIFYKVMEFAHKNIIHEKTLNRLGPQKFLGKKCTCLKTLYFKWNYCHRIQYENVTQIPGTDYVLLSQWLRRVSCIVRVGERRGRLKAGVNKGEQIVFKRTKRKNDKFIILRTLKREQQNIKVVIQESKQLETTERIITIDNTSVGIVSDHVKT